MARCECLAACPFFNGTLRTLPSCSELYKKTYCVEDNANCARYMVFRAMGREAVPPDLYPNDVLGASEVLSGTVKVSG
jgi:hypothetical protein